MQGLGLSLPVLLSQIVSMIVLVGCMICGLALVFFIVRAMVKYFMRKESERI